jgi:hypothetical protein
MLSIIGYVRPSTVARYYLIPYLVSGLLVLHLIHLSITHRHHQLVNHWYINYNPAGHLNR